MTHRHQPTEKWKFQPKNCMILNLAANLNKCGGRFLPSNSKKEKRKKEERPADTLILVQSDRPMVTSETMRYIHLSFLNHLTELW